MRPMSIGHSEMRFGRKRERTVVGRGGQLGIIKKKKSDPIHARNCSIDIDILYNLVPTAIYKVSITVSIYK